MLEINLGQAKLQSTEHTFIHYYKLGEIEKTYLDLQARYRSLVLIINDKYKNNTNFIQLKDYVRILNFTRDAINDKLTNILAHANHQRRRRGLINGLGTIAKFISGNLDANDGERYDKLIEHLTTNQNNIQNQLNLGYTLNTQILENFNRTIQDINFNNLLIKDKILEITANLQTDETLQKIRDTLIHLQSLYNIILNTLQDIENSLTFCKLKQLHPSIIQANELSNEIRKISKHYANKLPLSTLNNSILDFEEILTVECYLSKTEIVYLLKLPITDGNSYNLIQLYQIPFKHNSGYSMILSNVHYVLRLEGNKNSFKFLKTHCKQSKVCIYTKDDVTYQDHPCEQNFLSQRTTENCSVTEAQINVNLVEHIPNTPHYIAVLPKEDHITIQGSRGSATRTLQGIFIIDPEDQKVYFHEQELISNSSLKGKPNLITNFKLNFGVTNNNKFKLEFRKLGLTDSLVNRIIPRDSEPSSNYYVPSMWTILLYTSLTLFITYKLVVFIKSKFPKEEVNINPNVNPNANPCSSGILTFKQSA